MKRFFALRQLTNWEFAGIMTAFIGFTFAGYLNDNPLIAIFSSFFVNTYLMWFVMCITMSTIRMQRMHRCVVNISNQIDERLNAAQALGIQYDLSHDLEIWKQIGAQMDSVKELMEQRRTVIAEWEART